MTADQWPIVLTDAQRAALAAVCPDTPAREDRPPVTLRAPQRDAVLARMAARRQWDADWFASHRTPPLPAPERTAVPTDDMGQSAAALRRLAEGLGWKVETWYARGPKFHASRGTLLGTVDSVALTMIHPDGRYAQATWTAGKADRVKVWRAGEFPRRVAFAAGMKNAYTIKDWIEGRAVAGGRIPEPGQATEQGSRGAQ
jgi:hypothetical protein